MFTFMSIDVHKPEGTDQFIILIALGKTIYSDFNNQTGHVILKGKAQSQTTFCKITLELIDRQLLRCVNVSIKVA